MSVYSPAILRLALETARWPRLTPTAISGERRAPVCGSVMILDLVTVDARIESLGMDVRACALGQASAALFARSATGHTLADIRAVRAALACWLGGDDTAPEWPGLGIFEPARPLHARHGAILLPFDTALDVLSSPFHDDNDHQR